MSAVTQQAVTLPPGSPRLWHQLITCKTHFSAYQSIHNCQHLLRQALPRAWIPAQSQCDGLTVSWVINCCLYACAHTCTCTQTHTHTRTHPQTHTPTNTHALWKQIHSSQTHKRAAFIHTHIHAHSHACTHTHPHTHTFAMLQWIRQRGPGL